jgi:hypothetical protein
VALFQLEGSSNEETEFERVKFSEKGCGCSNGRVIRPMHYNHVSINVMPLE